jgi:hypothetical protein
MKLVMPAVREVYTDDDIVSGLFDAETSARDGQAVPQQLLVLCGDAGVRGRANWPTLDAVLDAVGARRPVVHASELSGRSASSST